jgi:hypothetical protein
MTSADDHLGQSAQFLWGLAGSVFPPLIRAFNAVDLSTDIPHIGTGFIVLALAIFIGGGLWSLAMGSDKAWKAVYNGATFPLVFGYLTHIGVPPGAH